MGMNKMPMGSGVNMTTNMLAIGIPTRETHRQFCERTGRTFIPMGVGNTARRMANVNAWYADDEATGPHFQVVNNG